MDAAAGNESVFDQNDINKNLWHIYAIYCVSVCVCEFPLGHMRRMRNIFVIAILSGKGKVMQYVQNGSKCVCVCMC